MSIGWLRGKVHATLAGALSSARDQSDAHQLFGATQFSARPDHYRSEIDGLRAIAVLPVILFHAGFDLFRGGFVGVDVFFVISGYLITSIILSEKQAGTFTLIGFYERRARRILPALFFVMLVCVPFAWWWMQPSQLKDFSKSLVAVSVYVSNILFWSERGYFEPAAELKPLLHTWSLAVEEQYYVLFPVFLLLTWRLGQRRIVGILVVMATLSLAVAQWGSMYHPNATFYLLPSRGWELLIGALIAFYRHTKENRTRADERAGRTVSQVGSMMGVLLIAYAVVTFSKRTPFPSVYALVPTVGAALIIGFAHPYTVVGKLLSSKLLVGIGLISYSAYLWHYPLFAFAWLRSAEDPSATLLVSLAVGSLVLAYGSWKWIEQPFRNKRKIKRQPLFIFAAGVSVLMVAVGLAGYGKADYDRRKLGETTNSRALDDRLRANYGLSSTCEETFTLSGECRTSEVPEILVWGDSFAMQLVPGILASKSEAKVIQMTRSACGPVYGLAVINPPSYTEDRAEQCLEFNNQVMAWLETQTSVKYAVLASPFDQYTSHDPTFLTQDGLVPFDPHVATQYFLHTLDLLARKGIKPVIFGPPPQNSVDTGRCLVRSTLSHADLAQCDFSVHESAPKQEAVIHFLSDVRKRYQVVWLADGICTGEVCKAALEHTFMYRDGLHLSYEGSALLGTQMKFYDRITMP